MSFMQSVCPTSIPASEAEYTLAKYPTSSSENSGRMYAQILRRMPDSASPRFRVVALK